MAFQTAFKIALKIAGRELRGGIRGFRIFLACLAMGVAAITAIGLVRTGIENGLQKQGAVILGGDASVELAYRFASRDERQSLEDLSERLSEIVDFRSMLVHDEGPNEDRALTQIKAVDEAYPLYGKVVLEPEMPLSEALAGDGTHPGIVIDPVLMDRLGIKIADRVRLGQQEFVVMAALHNSPDEAAGGFSLGPRSIVNTTALAPSGLLSSGSIFESEYRLQLGDTANLDQLRKDLVAAHPDSGFQWRDKRNAAPGVLRFVERLSAFLVLVGLTGLAVGGVGIAAAVRAYLQEKTPVIATLRSLGADGRTIFVTYSLQIGALTFLGIVLGLLIGALVPFLLAPVIESLIPIPTDFRFRAGPFGEAVLYGILSAALFTLWPLAQTEHIRAAVLFRERSLSALGRPRLFWMAVTVLILVLLVVSAAYFSGLVAITLWTAAGILFAFLVLIGAADLTRWAAFRLSKARILRGLPVFRSALGAVGGPASETRSVILSLGLGLTVLAAVGQVEWNLRNAILRDLPEVAPAYFLVDIQNDQLATLKDQFAANPAISAVETAPMLRGVLAKINGKPARSVVGNHWVVRGDRGITYADLPGKNTVITAGSFWPPDYTGPPQISFAREEAEEMGLKLGDMLTVNILGRDITAEVTSFRDVDFSTAGIGFVMTINPAAVRGAPHTHIATIYAQPSAEGKILYDIAQAFPNVTAIRVRDAIDRVSEVLSAIAAAITYGASATLLTGVLVLIGTAAAGERGRTYEGAILKTLGASRRAVLVNFALRSALMGLVAGLIAIFAGMAAGWAVTYFVMETAYQFEPVSALAIIAGGLIATLITGVIFAWRPLTAKPAQILRIQE